MKNSELENLLKRAKAPKHSREYREQFPKRVVAELRQIRRPERFETRRLPKLAWAMSTAAACAVIIFVAGHFQHNPVVNSSHELLSNTKLVSETLAMFPNRVRAIVQDERGLSLILSEHEDVPASTPLFVKVCDRHHCSAVVTFSGRRCRLVGEKLPCLRTRAAT